MPLPYRPLPPRVLRFRLDPASYRRLAGRALVKRTVLLGGFALSLPVALAWLRGASVAGLSTFAAAMAAGIALFAVVSFGGAVTPVLQRYELTMSDRVLRRVGAGPLTEVLRPEVSEIIETGVGLWVSCTTPRRSLFVVKAVDGYADVREALSGWAPIRPLRGWSALRYARRQRAHQGPRDAVLGTTLAADETLAAELEGVRAAGSPGLGAVGPASQRARSIAIWVLGLVTFWGTWQSLQPGPRRLPPTTDETCRQAPECRSWGRCHARERQCVAGSDDDCRQSEACTKLGRCRSVGGGCYRAEIAVPPDP